MRARWVFGLALALGLGAAARDGVDGWIDRTALPPLAVETGVEVRDRDGRLLRPYLVSDGRWRLAVTPDAVDPGYLAMLVRYEDKRFWTHAGVDPLAMLRAAGLALRHGQVVSGGSTLTMQVARLLEDGPTGEIGGKLRQVRLALALERRLSKRQILALYLDLAPMGGNLEGVRAASLAYFGKEPARLTPSEAALLVALPQSPEARRPDRAPAAARAARDRVLARMVAGGLLNAPEAAAARREPTPAARRDFPALAPHLADLARAADPAAPVNRLTLDAELQRSLEDLAAGALRGAAPKLQVAILVADHRSGEILASVGSADYSGADGRQGFVDMVRARRSPGSTLKPLVYALGFEAGMIHPETLVDDRPMRFGSYAPVNFDGRFRGEVRVRDALRLSLNLPAVAVLDGLGPAHLLAALRKSGARPELPHGGEPGLAVALGGIGMSLEDVVRGYAALARGGVAADLRWRGVPTPGFVPQRIVGPAAAWQVGDILRETPRPRGLHAPEIAYKTGTSYGHRDAWAVGYDGARVVGVWMGRADGTPVPGVFGGDLAAPVMFAAFARLGPAVPLPPPPPDTLIVSGAALPLPLQRFRPPGSVAAETAGPVIAFPPDGAVIAGAELVLKLRDAAAPYAVLANGRPVLRGRAPEVVLPDLGPGFSEVVVIDATGAADRVIVEMRPE